MQSEKQASNDASTQVSPSISTALQWLPSSQPGKLAAAMGLYPDINLMMHSYWMIYVSK